MHSIVIGTAGHIDHGKTTLVKALTGTDTDRLKEEKERGITIELGFAELQLDENLRAGIVDVPGHERFVRNMVAGTTGIDLVLLVVAADEGVMPQTREHLDICKLLGVERGVVALTKSDLAEDGEWLQMVIEDLRSELAGTFLEDSPIVRVSGKTGEGLRDLVGVLKEMGQRIQERSQGAPAFLGIDRAFSMHGFGTVLTGTLVSGHLQVGSLVDILPDAARRMRGLKIRGLQNHGRDTDRVVAGQRVAVNLSGVERSGLARGQALVRTGTLEAGHSFDTTIELVGGARPLQGRASAVFHTGTARSLATIRLAGKNVLHPGERGYARVRCEEPVAALPGHRFLLRGFVPLAGRGTTFGGGRILGILPARRSSKDPGQWLQDLALLDHGSTPDKVRVVLRQAAHPGLDLQALSMRTGMGTKELERELDKLMATQAILKFDREQGRFVEAAVLDRLRGQALRLLETFHRTHPLQTGMPAEQLRGSLAHDLHPHLFRLLVEELTRREEAAQAGEVIRLHGHRVELDAAGSELERSVLLVYQRAALTPPRMAEVAADHGRSESDVRDLVHHLVRTGVLAHVSGDMYVTTSALDELRSRLVTYLEENQEITTQTFKGMVGGSRKHVIPLAEYFDREKTTLRVGEKRVLRGKRADRKES